METTRLSTRGQIVLPLSIYVFQSSYGQGIDAGDGI